MKTGGRTILILMVIAVLVVAAVPIVFDLPDSTRIWIEIQNAGHTPLFGVISLLLLAISTRLFAGRVRRRRTHYAIAFIGTCVLGAITEYAQIHGPRDADLSDFLRDVTGAVSFLGFYAYYDTGLRQTWTRLKTGYRKMVLLVAIVVLAASAVPLARSSVAYIHRNGAFPIICDFDAYWGRQFLTTQSAHLKIVKAPSAMRSGKGKVGQLAMRAGEYPGFGVLETYPDWGDYRTLSVDIYSPSDTSVEIHIRVEDRHHNGDFADRFNRALSIKPGENHVVISLTDIKQAPAGREMDMNSVAAVYFFAVDLRQQLTLYFDNLRLQ